MTATYISTVLGLGTFTLTWVPRAALAVAALASAVQAIRVAPYLDNEGTKLRLYFVAVWSFVQFALIAYISCCGANEYIIAALSVSLSCIIAGWAWAAQAAISFRRTISPLEHTLPLPPSTTRER